MTPALALAAWERAAEEEIGIIITLADVRDKRRVERMLYEARQGSGNPDLQTITLAKPGDKPEEIWLIKQTTDMRDIK